MSGRKVSGRVYFLRTWGQQLLHTARLAVERANHLEPSLDHDVAVAVFCTARNSSTMVCELFCAGISSNSKVTNPAV